MSDLRTFLESAKETWPPAVHQNNWEQEQQRKVEEFANLIRKGKLTSFREAVQKFQDAVSKLRLE